MNDRVVIEAVFADDTRLTLAETSQRCHVAQEAVVALVDEGLVQPKGARPEEWTFDRAAVNRLRRALRLQRELEVDLAGVAVMMDLFDEVERLRRYVALLEHHMKY